MNLALDIGNTRTKLGLFRGSELVEQTVWTDWTGADLQAYCEQAGVERIAFASVAGSEEILFDLLADRFELRELTTETPLPFRNRYATPQTLGKDRLAAVAGAQALYPATDCLVIDCGTCIKYEWLTATGVYEGGNIAPGAKMRIQAMHHFTARLPEVPLELPVEEIGRSTQTALQNGALLGAILEIRGFVQLFRAKSPQLQVIITGGDAAFFAPHLEIDHLKVEPNLTLIGLNHLFTPRLQNT
ncbi:MAG: type III pantothenate kinase [Saprospiraceae bacterium]